MEDVETFTREDAEIEAKEIAQMVESWSGHKIKIDHQSWQQPGGPIQNGIILTIVIEYKNQ